MKAINDDRVVNTMNGEEFLKTLDKKTATDLRKIHRKLAKAMDKVNAEILKEN